MLKSLYVGIFLAITAIVCSVSIGLIDNYASPIIAKREQEKLNDTLSKVYADADSYDDVTIEYQVSLKSYETLKAVYSVTDDSNVIAYVYKVTTKGRNGEITALISIDNVDEVIEDITYLSHGETPGRGDRIELPEFLDNILGGSIDNEYNDTLAGATISSEAVNDSIQEVLSHFKKEVR